jgi:uncharacterized protein with ParB-like and HNH nuclease domain
MSETKTCFKKVDYDLSGLHHYIEIGDIGLPDIQRPFVWSNTKVRDLFDSMYRGMASAFDRATPPQFVEWRRFLRKCLVSFADTC